MVAVAGHRQRTRAEREREAAVRLGLVWLAAVGWPEGPLLVLSAADGRIGEAVRKERRRAQVMAGREGAAEVARWCFDDARAVVSMRRRLATALGPVRVSGEMYGVDSAWLASAVDAAALTLRAVPFDAAERDRRVAAEMGRLW